MRNSLLSETFMLAPFLILFASISDSHLLRTALLCGILIKIEKLDHLMSLIMPKSFMILKVTHISSMGKHLLTVVRMLLYRLMEESIVSCFHFSKKKISSLIYQEATDLIIVTITGFLWIITWVFHTVSWPLWYEEGPMMKIWTTMMIITFLM